jgi:hypothetical protein
VRGVVVDVPAVLLLEHLGDFLEIVPAVQYLTNHQTIPLLHIIADVGELWEGYIFVFYEAEPKFLPEHVKYVLQVKDCMDSSCRGRIGNYYGVQQILSNYVRDHQLVHLYVEARNMWSEEAFELPLAKVYGYNLITSHRL